MPPSCAIPPGPFAIRIRKRPDLVNFWKLRVPFMAQDGRERPNLYNLVE
jgi:hypothetical protein